MSTDRTPFQDVTGSPVDIKVTIPEQGLEAGDYTDASKEVADALTAMGWEPLTVHTWGFQVYVWNGESRCMEGNSHDVPKGWNHYPQAEFISRASVTSKKLGLVAKKEGLPPIEAGDWVRPGPDYDHSIDESSFHYTWPMKVLSVDRGERDISVSPRSGGLHRFSYYPGCQWVTKLSAEEVAKYHADLEAAKPIVPCVTKVMRDGEQWQVVHGPDRHGHYALVKDYEGECSFQSVPRKAFTVID